MRNEPVIALAEWLAGPEGINAQLATVTREAGDRQPPDVVVQDAARNAGAARGRPGEEDEVAGRVVFAVQLLGYEWEGELDACAVVRDGTVTLLVHGVGEHLESADGARAWSYYERAMMRSVTAFNRNANQAARTRNNLSLGRCLSIKFGRMRLELEDAHGTTGHIITYEVRDTAP